ncbi:MAG: tryptophan-rich sensory protein [Clostridia bacterium]|nr:tryptophan-rich sensory protein [Clostridia bacterium]NCC75331.1 tryptophan-rich sensory protein [Clostridia bacterium]
METQTRRVPTKLLVLTAYLVMILVNALANILPINGLTTGDVSDSYPNLFAPAGLTFAIWGVIYLALAGYVLYQFGLFQKNRQDSLFLSEQKIRLLFIVSSLANASWIFAWHYRLIPLTMALMLVLLISLAAINLITRKQAYETGGKVFVRLPFAIYFGWITVATIANVTTLLVDLEWTGAGLSEPIWTVLILLAGLLIGWVTTVFLKSIAYGLVLVWAYTGILLKHLSASGFDGQYPWVIVTVIGCLVLFAIALIVVVARGRKKLNTAIRTPLNQ